MGIHARMSLLVGIAIGLIVISLMGTFVFRVANVMPYINAAEHINFTSIEVNNEVLVIGDEVVSAQDVKEEIMEIIPELQDFLNVFLVVVVLMIVLMVIVDAKQKRKLGQMNF